jgi:hypothetical protein
VATYAYGLTIYESRGEMVAREPKMLTLSVGADEGNTATTNCANDLADAALYAWRLCYSYLSVAVDPPPKVGSPEWHQQEEEEMLQADIRRYHEQREAEADSWGMTVEEYEWEARWRNRRS